MAYQQLNMKFHNKADHKIGKQSIQNRLMNSALIGLMVSRTKDGGFNWSSILGSQPEGVVFPLGWGTSAKIKKSQFSTSCQWTNTTTQVGNTKSPRGSSVTIHMQAQLYDHRRRYFIILACECIQLLQSLIN